MPGKVLSIFICPNEGEPMREVQNVRALGGAGLEGDRYAKKTGTFSDSDENKENEKPRHVTLISMEDIKAANSELDRPFKPEETRRNIVVEGIDVNRLVNRRFRVGDVFMEGIELCEACDLPSKLSGKPDFKRAFRARGGVRAAIIINGTISVGDEVLG